MNTSIAKTILTGLVALSCTAHAAPEAPKISIYQDGAYVAVTWEPVSGAQNYTLHYLPYPYSGKDQIGTMDAGESLSLSALLWNDAAYYVAVTAEDTDGSSAYSNIEYFILNDGHLPFTSQFGSYNGLTLIAPMPSTTTYLIDDSGNALHQWSSDFWPGNSVYLLENGNLLRTGNDTTNTTFNAGGKGGYIEELDWDGNLLWQWQYSDNSKVLHHDIEPLPNGNILALAWAIHDDVWTEKIIEIEQVDTNDANILWEWDIWDHLDDVGLDADSATTEDWIHLNSIDYNSALNHIMISSRSHNKVWIIDRASGAVVTESTVETFGQHDARWIDPQSAASNITIFDNGRSNSRVLEVDGTLQTVIWEYGSEAGESFFADHISGAIRLGNGNTLICSGVDGTIFEVDSNHNKVWEFTNTYGAQTPQGTQNTLFRAEKYPTGYTPYF